MQKRNWIAILAVGVSCLGCSPAATTATAADIQDTGADDALTDTDAAPKDVSDVEWTDAADVADVAADVPDAATEVADVAADVPDVTAAPCAPKPQCTAVD